MARMPQVPAPDFGPRPDRHAGAFTAPDFASIEKPLESAANLASGIGDHFERLQQERDAATAKLQKVVDSVSATRMAGDHAEKARNLLTQVQQQNIDTPEKVPEEFRAQLRELTDSEIKAAPSQNVALDIAQKYATIDNQQATTAHSWMLDRLAQKAKSDFVALTNSQVRAAQAQTTLGGLGITISNALKTLEPHLKDLHAEPDVVREKLQHDMAAAWVEANSPNNPVGVSSALDQKKGPLAQHLTPKERLEFQRRAFSDLKGYGEIQRFQVIKEAVDHGSQAYDLFLGGNLDSKNVFQMKDALEKKQAAIAANPNLTVDEREAQADIVQTQLSTLRYLDEAARKPGRFDPAFDQEKQTKLLNDFFALGKPTDHTPKDMLKIVRLRHDLAEAQSNRWISDARAQTMNRALTQMTGKALSHETKNTGWPISFLGFGGRSPQQAGNVVLNSYFKGDNKAFGKLTVEQQNQARVDYLSQIVDAQENGRNLDAKTAEKMAFDAVAYVAGRARRPAGGP